jgi:hypothetical protein
MDKQLMIILLFALIVILYFWINHLINKKIKQVFSDRFNLHEIWRNKN